MCCHLNSFVIETLFPKNQTDKPCEYASEEI